MSDDVRREALKDAIARLVTAEVQHVQGLASRAFANTAKADLLALLDRTEEPANTHKTHIREHRAESVWCVQCGVWISRTEEPGIKRPDHVSQVTWDSLSGLQQEAVVKLEEPSREPST